MTTPPTFVSFSSGGFTGATTPKTANVAPLSGDILVVVATTETDTTTVATPTGGTGLTWTLRQSLVGSSFAAVYIWTAPVPSNQTSTISVARAAGSGEFGFGVYIYRAHGGVGASNSSSGTGLPTLTLTDTVADSAVIMVSTDWNTTPGTATWPTVNGSAPTVDVDVLSSGASRYYAVHYADAGPTGGKALGPTAPSGQKYQILAIEILGTTTASVQPSAGFFAADC